MQGGKEEQDSDGSDTGTESVTTKLSLQSILGKSDTSKTATSLGEHQLERSRVYLKGSNQLCPYSAAPTGSSPLENETL